MLPCPRRDSVACPGLHRPGGADADLRRVDSSHDRSFPSGRAAGLGEKCGQCSSYDRASRYDEKTGKYVNWAANGDGDGIIRTRGRPRGDGRDERPGLHLADLVGRGRQGPREDLPRRPAGARRRPAVHRLLRRQARSLRLPGALLQHGQDRLRRAEPVLSDPLSEIVQGGGGQGLGQLLPLHLRDLSRRNRAAHLQRRAGCTARADAAKPWNDFFADGLGTDPAGKRPGQETLAQSVRVAPGETARVARLDGPRAITALWAKIKFGNRADQMAGLRKLALRITWDGQAEAGGLVPAGRFLRHGARA